MFYPIVKKQESLLNDIRSNPERSLYCIDWDDENPMEVYGEYIDLNYSKIEILYTPCDYLH